MPAGHRPRGTFGKPLAEQGVIQDWIAESRIEIEQARLLTLKAAWLMDTVGNKGAAIEISAIKVAGPNMALKVIDRAIQAHGAGGVSDDFPLARMYAGTAHPALRRRPRRGAPSSGGAHRDRPPRLTRLPETWTNPTSCVGFVQLSGSGSERPHRPRIAPRSLPGRDTDGH